MDFPEVSLKSILYAGDKKINSEKAEAELAKIGTLRGGNSGCLVEDKYVIGKCHRISLARYMGYSAPTGDHSRWTFDEGLNNETMMEIRLIKGWDGEILREEEIPTSWKTKDGTPVTGRPDAVLLKDGKRKVVAELKGLTTDNSISGMFFEGKPKSDNLCQAAHYMWQLNIPGWLVYTSNITLKTIPWWVKNKFKVPPKTIITPFDKVFDLKYDEIGRLIIRDEDKKITKTNITQQGIKDYYELVTELVKSKELGPMHSGLDHTGVPMPFDPCDYCSLRSACDSTNNFNEWIDEVKEICER